MPLKLSHLVADRASVTLEGMDGESAVIHYRPTALTPRLIRQMQAADEQEDDSARAVVMADILEHVITGWEGLLDDDDQPLPYSRDAMEDMGIDVLIVIMNKIYAGAKVGEANGASNGTPSGLPSSPRAKPGSSRR